MLLSEVSRLRSQKCYGSMCFPHVISSNHDDIISLRKHFILHIILRWKHFNKILHLVGWNKRIRIEYILRIKI